MFAVDLSAQSPSPPLAHIRAALEKYRNPIVALEDGYLSTLVCVEYPAIADAGHVGHAAGGMGVHFLNPALIGPQLDSLTSAYGQKPAGILSDGCTFQSFRFCVPCTRKMVPIPILSASRATSLS